MKPRALLRYGMFLAFWLMLGTTVSGKAVSFYVATNGNDGWSGTLARANRNGTDGPFATVERAQRAVRNLKTRLTSPATADQPITVWIREGDYFLSQPLVFTPEDSGTAKRPVIYRAYGREKPVLSGGQRLVGWQRVTRSGREVWATAVPPLREGRWSFHQLWIDQDRAVRARHPNTGYLAVAELSEAKPDTSWMQGQSSFRFRAGDIGSWAGLTNAEVCVMNRWVESHLPVIGLDAAERWLQFGKRSVFKLEVGDLYYVENALELLDTPGEWFLDGSSRTLYYLPKPGQDMAKAKVIAPVLPELVRLAGQPQTGQFVEHLHFVGLTFAHTEWYFPGGTDQEPDRIEVEPVPSPEVGGFAQAAVGVPGAVRGNGARDCVFDQCRWVHLGGYGLELQRGCQQNDIVRCELSDLGAGGIKIGETALRKGGPELTRNNRISDCHIYNGGRFYHSAIGIWVGQSPDNRIVHNHIHDFYYTGISLGWTWGYGPALATNTLVELNHVHHIGRRADGDGPILSDMAGIYTLGRHTGTVIRNNLWHDVAGLRYGGWGIYFDEGTTEILAENNLVYRTTHGGFHQHYGKENTVRNNIFALARDFQIQRSRVEQHRSFVFEHNLVYWKQGKLLEGNLSDTNYLFRANLYWNPENPKPKFSQWTFEEWQRRGQDVGSLVTDPGFVNPARDDYRLRARSPALRLGFKPLDLDKVGVRR